MRYALVGYGKMGREIDRIAGERGHERGLIIDREAGGRHVRRDLDVTDLAGIEVAYEFTEPGAAPGNVASLIEAGVNVICGTTGWSVSRGLRKAVGESGVGLVAAPNFSVGMNLFYRLVREAARRIGAAGLHQPYVFESHHVGKKDAPSGTAGHIADLVARSDPRRPGIHRGDADGGLPEGAVHVASLRAGHEPGRHVVGFDGEHDAIELSHRARSRAGFALGAVLAGEWVLSRPGVHRFESVLDDLLRAEPGRRNRGGGR